MLMRLTAVLTVGAALTLGACAVDSQMSYVSYLPDFLKQASAAAKVEVPPDVPAILRSNINAVFVSTSAALRRPWPSAMIIAPASFDELAAGKASRCHAGRNQ
jgi:hypothetical protein